jgi:hypothetical protein
MGTHVIGYKRHGLSRLAPIPPTLWRSELSGIARLGDASTLRCLCGVAGHGVGSLRQFPRSPAENR